MAYSPSLLAAAGHSQLSHHSVSPPLPHPISKREKRKHDMEERFAQIGRDFKEDRQKNFHKQIHNLQIDGDFIRNADLYADKALHEFGDDTAEDVTISATASTHGSVRTLNLNGNTKLEMPFKNGTYATKFTQVINDAMEQRDADLTTVAVCSTPLTYRTMAICPWDIR